MLELKIPKFVSYGNLEFKEKNRLDKGKMMLSKKQK
jgi:hypothetical protein